MSAHIDNTYVENAIGAAAWDAMCSSSAAVKTQLIASASSVVDAVLINAGYSPPTASAPDLVKTATLGALLPQVYGRRGLQVPDHLLVNVNVFEAIRRGDLPIPNLAPSTSEGTGGSKFSDSSSTTTDGRPRVFKDMRRVF